MSRRSTKRERSHEEIIDRVRVEAKRDLKRLKREENVEKEDLLRQKIEEKELKVLKPVDIEPTRIKCGKCGKNLIANKIWTIITPSESCAITLSEIMGKNLFNKNFSDFWKNLSLIEPNPVSRMGANRLYDFNAVKLISKFLETYTYMIEYKIRQGPIVGSLMMRFELPSRIVDVAFSSDVGFVFICENNDYYSLGYYTEYKTFYFRKIAPFYGKYMLGKKPLHYILDAIYETDIKIHVKKFKSNSSKLTVHNFIKRAQYDFSF